MCTHVSYLYKNGFVKRTVWDLGIKTKEPLSNLSGWDWHETKKQKVKFGK